MGRILLLYVDYIINYVQGKFQVKFGKFYEIEYNTYVNKKGDEVR